MVAEPPAFAADPAFVSFPVPTANAGLSGITLGPDGAMWFTGSGIGVVGTIDAVGVFTEFALPDPLSGPAGIAAGPDGALWVTLEDDNAIGRLAPVGGFVSYPLPADESSPTGITAGPDDANQVARVTTSGDVRLFAIPTATSRPLHIAADAANEVLWFVEGATDKLVRLSYDGTLVEFDTDAGGRPTGVTVDAGGRPWITELRANAIGVLDRSLTLVFSTPGWTGAAAIFGPVEFPATSTKP